MTVLTLLYHIEDISSYKLIAKFTVFFRWWSHARSASNVSLVHGRKDLWWVRWWCDLLHSWCVCQGGPRLSCEVACGGRPEQIAFIARFLLLQISSRSLQLSFICSAVNCCITSLLPTFSDSTLLLKPSIRRSTFLLDTFPTSLCTSL